jgi:hypothetical protein
LNGPIFIAAIITSSFAFYFSPRWTGPLVFSMTFISASLLYVSGMLDEALWFGSLAFAFLIGALIATLGKQNDIYKLWK